MRHSPCRLKVSQLRSARRCARTPRMQATLHSPVTSQTIEKPRRSYQYHECALQTPEYTPMEITHRGILAGRPHARIRSPGNTLRRAAAHACGRLVLQAPRHAAVVIVRATRHRRRLPLHVRQETLQPRGALHKIVSPGGRGGGRGVALRHGRQGLEDERGLVEGVAGAAAAGAGSGGAVRSLQGGGPLRGNLDGGEVGARLL